MTTRPPESGDTSSIMPPPYERIEDIKDDTEFYEVLSKVLETTIDPGYRSLMEELLSDAKLPKSHMNKLHAVVFIQVCDTAKTVADPHDFKNWTKGKHPDRIAYQTAVIEAMSVKMKMEVSADTDSKTIENARIYRLTETTRAKGDDLANRLVAMISEDDKENLRARLDKHGCDSLPNGSILDYLRFILIEKKITEEEAAKLDQAALMTDFKTYQASKKSESDEDRDNERKEVLVIKYKDIITTNLSRIEKDMGVMGLKLNIYTEQVNGTLVWLAYRQENMFDEDAWHNGKPGKMVETAKLKLAEYGAGIAATWTATRAKIAAVFAKKLGVGAGLAAKKAELATWWAGTDKKTRTKYISAGVGGTLAATGLAMLALHGIDCGNNGNNGTAAGNGAAAKNGTAAATADAGDTETSHDASNDAGTAGVSKADILDGTRLADDVAGMTFDAYDAGSTVTADVGSSTATIPGSTSGDTSAADSSGTDAGTTSIVDTATPVDTGTTVTPPPPVVTPVPAVTPTPTPVVTPAPTPPTPDCKPCPTCPSEKEAKKPQPQPPKPATLPRQHKTPAAPKQQRVPSKAKPTTQKPRTVTPPASAPRGEQRHDHYRDDRRDGTEKEGLRTDW